MLNLVSLLIGIVSLVLALVAFIPFLGWANWFIIPLAIIGTRNLNIFVIVIGALRLMLGGGFL
jgi:hypothetical protein